MSYGDEARSGCGRARRRKPRRGGDRAGEAVPGHRRPDLTISQATQVTAPEQSARPQAIALAAFAALAGLIVLAVLGQLLCRQLALESAEFPVLRAFGATRRSLVTLSLARLAIVTVAGGSSRWPSPSRPPR